MDNSFTIIFMHDIYLRRLNWQLTTQTRKNHPVDQALFRDHKTNLYQKLSIAEYLAQRIKNTTQCSETEPTQATTVPNNVENVCVI